jgi:hypothetical protein
MKKVMMGSCWKGSNCTSKCLSHANGVHADIARRRECGRREGINLKKIKFNFQIFSRVIGSKKGSRINFFRG